MRILFLIPSLDRAGAERQLVNLAIGLHRQGHVVRLVTFYPGGPLEENLRTSGVPVESLGKYGRWDVFRFALRLVRLIKREAPDIVHGYMHANILTVPLKVLFPKSRSVWGIRDSNMDLSQYDWLAPVVESMARKLSQFADLIIVNSWAGRDSAISRGYAPHHMKVIPNGIDTAEFYPDKAAGAALRACWGLAPQDILIGRIGRLNPMKDYPTFLEAAAEFKKRFPNARFLCMGAEQGTSERDLYALATRLDLGRNLIFSGARKEMRGVYSALTLLTSSSSYGEGFPNVVGEALACGVPCVVTDVGDSSLLIGNPEFVVPPRNPQALATAWGKCLQHGAPWNIDEARQRIVTNYSLETLTRLTEAALLRVSQRGECPDTRNEVGRGNKGPDTTPSTPKISGLDRGLPRERRNSMHRMN
jgi:glycosyltransferase involved in cell wall biosynthesis